MQQRKSRTCFERPWLRLLTPMAVVTAVAALVVHFWTTGAAPIAAEVHWFAVINLRSPGSADSVAIIAKGLWIIVAAMVLVPPLMRMQALAAIFLDRKLMTSHGRRNARRGRSAGAKKP